MKKVTAIVLALLMVLSLAACGSAASESKTLVMATSADYPPYEFIVLNDKNEQQYVGIDVSRFRGNRRGYGQGAPGREHGL